MARHKLDTKRSLYGSDCEGNGSDDEKASLRKKVFINDTRESISKKTKPDEADTGEKPETRHTCNPADQLLDDFEQDDFLPPTLQRVFESTGESPLDDIEDKMDRSWEAEILELIEGLQSSQLTVGEMGVFRHQTSRGDSLTSVENRACSFQAAAASQSDYQTEYGSTNSTLHVQFPPLKNSSPSLDPARTRRIEDFRNRIFRIIEFLQEEARKTTLQQLIHEITWINLAFWLPLRRSTPRAIFQIFEAAIPESTMAILGHDQITSAHLLSLPLVDAECRGKVGVYIDCATQRDGSRSLDEAATVPSITALYTGSSTDDLKVRVDHQEGDLATRNSQNGRYYHRQIVQKYDLQPNFRRIALFPEELPEAGIACANAGWLIRLLETVMMLLLDSYRPCDRTTHRIRWGVTLEMYYNALERCGISRSWFMPLNKALPTKQSVNDATGTRKCRNCQTTQSLGWYYDIDNFELATVYLCRACYRYRWRLGVDRPSFLLDKRSPPQHGPCSNCNTTSTTRWRWHLRLADHVLCCPCYMWLWKFKGDRPMHVWVRKQHERVCISCWKSESEVTNKKWSPVRDAFGCPTGYYRCPSCNKDRVRQVNRLIRQWGWYRCYVCHTTESSGWPTPRTCQECHDKGKADAGLKLSRDRSDCHNCGIAFTGKTRRCWNPTLKQWHCNACNRCIVTHRCHRITTKHLRDLEIPCECCSRLRAKRWMIMDYDPIADKEIGRILCGSCFSQYKHVEWGDKKSPVKIQDKTTAQPQDGKTFNEWITDRAKHKTNRVMVDYLNRVCGLVFTIEDPWEVRLGIQALRLQDEHEADEPEEPAGDEGNTSH